MSPTVPPPPDTAYIRDLIARDDRCRRLFAGLPQAGEEQRRRALPCRHLGKTTGTRTLCPTCQGHVEVKLKACAVHGECHPEKPLDGVPWCQTCAAYEPRRPAPPPEPVRAQVPGQAVIGSAGAPVCGLAIGSYGDARIVELQIRMARHYCGTVPVLVADDTPAGPILDEIEALEQAYPDVTVWPNPERLGHYAGDLSAFGKALQWGHTRGFSVVAKLSKRFLVTRPHWLQEGAAAMLAANAATSSQPCVDRGTGHPVQLYIRSEAVLLDVARWLPHYQLFNRRELGEATELYLWDLIVRHFGGELYPWALFDEERNRWHPDTVWHCTNAPSDYHEWARRFGVQLDAQFSTNGAQGEPGYKKG